MNYHKIDYVDFSVHDHQLPVRDRGVPHVSGGMAH